MSNPEGVFGGSWFPSGRDKSSGWRLDIVSLLAVIGESSVATHSREMNASWTCLLPRLIPAPQALLQSSRAPRLDSVPATVIGVKSGSKVEELSFFANLLHEIDRMEPYAFNWYEITYNRAGEDGKAAKPHQEQPIHGLPIQESEKLDDLDEEKGGAQFTRINRLGSVMRRNTLSSQSPPKKAPIVPPKRSSPSNWVSVTSCALSVGAFIWAGLIMDGVALLAIFCISSASSLIGAGLWWHPILAQRSSQEVVPPGDVIIKIRNGAFIYVKCNEHIARELYFGTERCNYYLQDINLFRACSGFGTLLIMVSVVLLGNCSWTMQAVIGAAYLLLNGMFWATSLLGKNKFWDLSRYECTPIKPSVSPFNLDAHKEHGKIKPSFTRTLWYAIKASGDVGWVRSTDAVPDTIPWNKWLEEAQGALAEGLDWDPVEAKDRYMQEAVKNDKLMRQPAPDNPH